MKILSEKFAFSGGKVDRSGARPMVRGVLLCGPVSENRRRYLKRAFAGEAVKKYDGAPVFIGHGDGRSERTYAEQIGTIRNPRHRADGMPVGDVEVKPKHPLAEQFIDDATNNPRSVGFSHVAHCATERAADGWEEVTSIERILSADIVLSPATTRGLFESSRRKKPMTVRRLIESVLKNHRASPRAKAKARRLREVADDAGAELGGDMMGADADAPTGDGDEDVTAAMKAAILAVVDRALNGDLDAAEALKKIKALFGTHSSINDTGAAGEPGDEDAEAEESRRRAFSNPAAFAERYSAPRGASMAIGEAFSRAQREAAKARDAAGNGGALPSDPADLARRWKL